MSSKIAEAVVENWLSGFGEPPLQLSQLQKDRLVIGIASAIERGKAEGQLHAMTQAQEMQDTAVRAARRAILDLKAATKRAMSAEAKLARLANPDEALIVAAGTAGFRAWQDMGRTKRATRDGDPIARAEPVDIDILLDICRALALALALSQ